MANTDKSKRRVRVSKNKKKSWNKFCDVQDVELYLEEKRFEERIGGSVSEKPDADLFILQTTTEPPEKAKKLKKTLKCHQSIGSFTKVPPPINLNTNSYSKKIKNSLNRAEEKRCKKFLAKTSSPGKNSKKNVENNRLFTNEICDLWSTENEEIDPEIEEFIKYRDEITEKTNPKVPAHRYQKPSLLQSVEVPHAGASYNPSYEDHQKLLHEAVVIEERKEKEELHLKRVLTDMFPTKDKAPTEESILKEMSQGLFDDSDMDEENDVCLFTSRNPPVSAEDRLTRSRKRKRKELKEEARKKLLEKKNKKRLNDVYRIPSLKKQIKLEKEMSEKKQKKKWERKIESMYQPHTLSKHKYEPPDLEVHLSEDIPGSLRQLKVEGNLLEDRYKSLQRRNFIEPRVKQNMKRKYKLKVQVKRSHRNFV